MNDREAAEKLRRITESIGEKDEGRMNSLLSPRLESCDADRMATEIRFDALDWEKNQRDEIHGGAISAMFDTAMGITVLVYTDTGRQIATADLNVSFIRPFTGDSFIFRSEIINSGRFIVRVRSTAYDSDTGKCVASATSNYVHVDR